MANFRVGQKVVCVDARSEPGCAWGATEEVKTGAVYTVARSYILRGRPTLQLVEITRDAASIAAWGPEVGYGAARFRPVAERPTAMEVIRAIVANPKRKIPADKSEPKLPAPVPEYVQGENYRG